MNFAETIINQKVKIMRYYVSVTEMFSKVVSVEANDEKEAIEKVKDAYCESEIVLESDDFVEDSTIIELDPDQDGCRATEDIYDGDFYQHID